MDVLQRLDAEVDKFCNSVRFFREPLTVERAKMFVRQHRLNTRYRNSVLKLSVAVNTPDWDTRMGIINASSQELIADHEFGGGNRTGRFSKSRESTSGCLSMTSAARSRCKRRSCAGLRGKR